MPRSAVAKAIDCGRFPSHAPSTPKAHGPKPPDQSARVTPVSPPSEAATSAKPGPPSWPRWRREPFRGESRVDRPGTLASPSPSVFPCHFTAPSASWRESAAPGTTVPSDTRVTQTMPEVAPSLLCTARSVICPVTRCVRRHPSLESISGAVVTRWKRPVPFPAMSSRTLIGRTPGRLWVPSRSISVVIGCPPGTELRIAVGQESGQLRGGQRPDLRVERGHVGEAHRERPVSLRLEEGDVRPQLVIGAQIVGADLSLRRRRGLPEDVGHPRGDRDRVGGARTELSRYRGVGFVPLARGVVAGGVVPVDLHRRRDVESRLERGDVEAVRALDDQRAVGTVVAAVAGPHALDARRAVGAVRQANLLNERERALPWRGGW